jgi:uncharacterized membrane protein
MRTPLESANSNLFDENASPVPEHVGRTAWRLGLAFLLALIALQFAWYLWWLPPASASPWLPLSVFALPLIVPALFALLRFKKALFWAGFIGMLHFTHGVMEAWTVPAALWPGIAEALLAAGLCCAAAWHGLSRRIYWRKLVQASQGD